MWYWWIKASLQRDASLSASPPSFEWPEVKPGAVGAL